MLIKRLVLIGTAIASSAAIAAWAKWTDLASIWGGIIVVSQVVSAVFEVLPIKKRSDSLFALTNQLDLLYIEVENTWREINHLNKFSDEEINKLILEYERRWSLISNKELGDDMLPHSKRMKKKAFDEANKYMINRLGGEPLNEPSK